MKHTTTVMVEIEHDEALPEKGMNVTDVLSQRAHQWLHAAGLRCVATARVAAEVTELDEPVGRFG